MSTNKNLNLENFLNEIAEELPIIRPISEFIHLNLLLPYQHLPFWDAVKTVSSKFEAMPFAELTLYQAHFKSGFLPLDLVAEKYEKLRPDSRIDLLTFLTEGKFEFQHHDMRVGRLHHLWNKQLGINLIQLSDSMLIKWLSAFLDQGIGHWEMPKADQLSFYSALKNLLEKSYVRPCPFRSSFQFHDSAESSIREDLKFLCPDTSYQLEYLRESIFTLRGWVGLVFCLEKNPQLLPFRRKITLIDFIAIKLRLEKAWILEHDVNISAPDFSDAEIFKTNLLLHGPYFDAFRACQEALEEVTYKTVLKGITEVRSVSEKSQFQTVFCMDDRECSLRRHLEESSPEIETFGTAGHFGIECLYHHSDDAYPKKQCPAPLPPKYLIREFLRESRSDKEKTLSHHFMQPSHNLLEEWLRSILGGIRSAGALGMNLFFPLAFKKLKNVVESTPDSELKFLNQGEGPTEDGLKIGYTLEEMADLLYQQLMLIGFVHNFAPLVFFIGHGSNSVNNPYFATYGCGACSGRPGSANARILASIANITEVRSRMKEKYGLDIPEETIFLGGFHDTCRDVVEIFNPERIPAPLKQSFQKFKKYLSVSLYKNARERSQAFKLVTFRKVSKEAQKEVFRRSYSLFETRPELGHTDVAFSIVGRRNFTKGMNLKRRSFLQSYDRSIDPTGEILAASLGAVIPVTSGINLDYYFSRVDNQRFGAGSKLPQNIVGNIGVSHGTESDLLFGLPFQMIDQHTPLRLFVLVEHSPEVALHAIQKNPLVKEIVLNNWIHYGCWDEATNSFYIFRDDKMVKLGMDLEGLC